MLQNKETLFEHFDECPEYLSTTFEGFSGEPIEFELEKYEWIEEANLSFSVAEEMASFLMSDSAAQETTVAKNLSKYELLLGTIRKLEKRATHQEKICAYAGAKIHKALSKAGER